MIYLNALLAVVYFFCAIVVLMLQIDVTVPWWGASIIFVLWSTDRVFTAYVGWIFKKLKESQ
jgi:hypothetical protein